MFGNRSITQCFFVHNVLCDQFLVFHLLFIQLTTFLSNFVKDKNKNKLALARYRIRPTFLRQLMLSCENECTLSALCTKAPHQKVPSVQCEQGDVHSEGHLAVLFYIFFHHKNVVFLCFMWCSGDLFCREHDKRARFLFHRVISQSCVETASVYQLPLGVKHEEAKRDSEEISCSLYNRTSPKVISSCRSDHFRGKQ